MQTIIPPKLKPDDTFCAVAPSMSLSTISNERREIANKGIKN